MPYLRSVHVRADKEKRHRALVVCEFIAGRGWLTSEPEDAALIRIRIDDAVPDGDIHLKPDCCYYLSTRTAERRVRTPWVRVWCHETGEFVCESRIAYYVPYIPTRASALSNIAVSGLA